MKTLILLITMYACLAFTGDTNAEYRSRIEPKDIYGMPGDFRGTAVYAKWAAEWGSARPDKIKVYFQFQDSTGNEIGAGNRMLNWTGGVLDSTSIAEVVVPALNITPITE